ncbi:MAG TPA: hypothetical protein VER33_04875, partial [Polyangiaceae bacterium]|nr:hypothetical protein [Polyangiaceae bacterium]
MRDPWQEAQRLLDEPAGVEPYARWLDQQPERADDYLFAESRARFDLEPGDVLRVPSDLSFTPTSGGVELRSAALGGSVRLPELDVNAVLRVLAHIDGTRTLNELRARAGSDRPLLERVVQGGFGSWLFAPAAVLALESEVSGVELVRFVGTPYEIVRPYWRNMNAVRRLSRRYLELARDPRTATRWLRTLHVIALIGEDQRTFYRPASRTAARGSRPGELYTTGGQRASGEAGTLLLSGPRVGVGLPGGATYQHLVYARAGDAEALLEERSLSDAEGLDWGALVPGRAPHEPRDAPWFCPPRP